MRRARPVLALLALGAAACTAGTPATRSGTEGVVAEVPLADLDGDLVPVPGHRAGPLQLTAYRTERPATRPEVDTHVVDVAGAIVTIRSEPLATPGFPNRTFEDLGPPGPLLEDGRPTREVYDEVLRLRSSLAVAAPDGSLVIAASREASLEALADVLALAAVPLDADELPGELVGVLREGRPSSSVAVYEGDERGVVVTLDEVTPSEQAAYRAVVHDDPGRTIDPATEASCCADAILEPLREVDLGPRTGWIATLTPYERVLVLDGDPGLVLRTTPGTEPADRDLLLVAAAVEAATPAERDGLIVEVTAARRDREAAATAAYEESIGWEVVDRVDFEEGAVLLTTGEGPRRDLPEPLEAGLCAVVAPQQVAACLPPGAPEALEVAFGGADVIFGSAPATTRRVEVVYLEGSVDAVLVDLEAGGDLPPLVFVLHLPVQDQIELSGADLTEGMAAAEVVAYDRAGRELGRSPLFAHLRG